MARCLDKYLFYRPYPASADLSADRAARRRRRAATACADARQRASAVTPTITHSGPAPARSASVWWVSSGTRASSSACYHRPLRSITRPSGAMIAL